MPWLFLLAAIAAELVGTTLLKATDGFTRPGPTAACLLAYAISFLALSQAVRDLPVAVVYALWSGLGTAAVAVLGVLWLGEPLTALKAVGIGFIILGVVLVQLSGGH